VSEKLSTILLLAISFLPIWSWMTQYRLTNVPLGYLLFIILWKKIPFFEFFFLEKKWRIFFPYVKWVFSAKICHFWTNKCFEKGKNIVSNRMFSLVPIWQFMSLDQFWTHKESTKYKEGKPIFFLLKNFIKNSLKINVKIKNKKLLSTDYFDL